MATYSKGSLRERSKGHWQARFCRTDRNGSSIVTRSFEATSRRAATLIMEDIRRELIEQDGDGASSRELIAYMLDYVDERERSQQIEANTATNCRSSIKHLARYLEGYSIEEITPEKSWTCRQPCSRTASSPTPLQRTIASSRYIAAAAMTENSERSASRATSSAVRTAVSPS